MTQPRAGRFLAAYQDSLKMLQGPGYLRDSDGLAPVFGHLAALADTMQAAVDAGALGVCGLPEDDAAIASAAMTLALLEVAEGAGQVLLDPPIDHDGLGISHPYEESLAAVRRLRYEDGSGFLWIEWARSLAHMVLLGRPVRTAEYYAAQPETPDDLYS